VRAYLSRQHVKEVANSCPMVSLPSDVARAGKGAKRAYQKVFEAMVEILQRGSRNHEQPDRTTALAIAALCVGGMVIVRASHDHPLTEELRSAAMAVALRLGGWDDTTGSKARRPRSPHR